MMNPAAPSGTPATPATPDAPGARPPALLLLGPTGAGKSPLGELLEAEGLGGRRCVHFEFGLHLRLCAAAPGPARAALTPTERAFLRHVLDTGVLLEDKDFPLARKILLGVLAACGTDARTLVILNGLPRHVGQAEALAPLLEMKALVHLACTPEVVLERIRTNAGGDRTERADDDLAAVRRRLELFRQRTAPLLDHYRQLGVPVLTVPVSATTTPREVLRQLALPR
jgi:adenylate kinase